MKKTSITIEKLIKTYFNDLPRYVNIKRLAEDTGLNWRTAKHWLTILHEYGAFGKSKCSVCHLREYEEEIEQELLNGG